MPARKLGRWGALAAVVVACGAAIAGCSLTNIVVDECSDDDECADAFGIGSQCLDGYCSEPTSCQTGHDCRRVHGGGACVAGLCVDTLPPDPMGACTLFEPESLPDTQLTGPDAPHVVGGMFLFEVDFSPPIIDAARLAVRDINSAGGLGLSRRLAMVVCDNGGPKNSFEGAERDARIQGVIDYLAGTLGVPYIVGPLTSGDAVATVQYLLSKSYPTVLISPSATSPALTGEPDRLQQDDPYGMFWRTAPSDELQGEVLATDVAGVYPTPSTVTNVVAAYRDDPYGLGLANAFQVSFAGQTVLQKFDIGGDLVAAAASAAAAAPDAVLFVDIGGDRATAFIEAMAAEPALADKPLYLADGSKTDTLLDAALPTASKNIIFTNAVGTVAASPEGATFSLFQSRYQSEWGKDPANFAFTANGYDAVFVGSAGVVYAAQSGNNYDGRTVTEGLARLVGGAVSAEASAIGWSTIKNALTSGDRRVDIVGVSGPLDFDVATGQAPAAIEIWKPSQDSVSCSAQGTTAPCIIRLELANP